MPGDDWDLSPPPRTALGDREVPREGRHLEGRRVALMITGGIAAMKAPLLARALRRQGADVVAFASEEGLRYVTAEALEWSTLHPVVTRLTPEAEHLSDARPFDAYLVAPATYNTINKLRHGIADGAVTAALASALGRMERGETRVLIVPTMHGSLHTSILTESLRTLAELGVRIVPPREDYGKHNLPAEEALVAEVCRALSRSPLRGVPILVAGGPTPVPVDAVRRLTNRFRGTLGILTAEELHLRGAHVHLLLGDGGGRPPAHLPHTLARTYDDYRREIGETLAAGGHRAAVFSAAVADYAPREVLPGKVPSGGELRLDLAPLPKVIEEVRERFPALYMVTFKYEEGVTHDELMATARERLERYPVVVANRGEEMGEGGAHVAYLVTREEPEPVRAVGKPAIARAIADHLERHLGERAAESAGREP